MAKKVLPKDIDLTQNINPADGFFTTPDSEKDKIKENGRKKLNAPVKPEVQEPKKNLGGRPPKNGLKNEQYTLTMHPKLYEKLRIIAQEKTGGNFSALVEMAIKTYCEANEINLDEIEVEPAILNAYQNKQDKKRNKK